MTGLATRLALTTPVFALLWACPSRTYGDDPIARLQANAIEQQQAAFGHWGPDPSKYSSWTTHSNRLVPVYIFGGDLSAVAKQNSCYRSEAQLTKLYGSLPENTLNPDADYFDQCDIHSLQLQGVHSGKKRVILFVFDGMDWQTTRAAAIAKTNSVSYDTGRGSGLAFQDYQGAQTDFGYMVTSPHNNGTSTNVDKQLVTNPGGKTPGGFSPRRGGNTPWSSASDALYPLAKSESLKHAYTDSASSATSMTSGIKTFNNAINIDPLGREVFPLGRQLQEEGFGIGVVTSVPISHATPACAYASNVHRSDYQDLTRDMLGLPSIKHPGALPGVDVLIGAGWGEWLTKDAAQGDNFDVGNRYVAPGDLQKADVRGGGQYVIAQRTARQRGSEVLSHAVKKAVHGDQRLFGLFGVKGGHLPYQTANGDYRPVGSIGNPEAAKPEVYSTADIEENVTLAEMTMAAVEVLNSRGDQWWLMVEAGDVDWANHSNNIDNSIGAVLSGELAFQQLTRWIEENGGWEETLLIVTADHGHYLTLDEPALLTQ